MIIKPLDFNRVDQASTSMSFISHQPTDFLTANHSPADPTCINVPGDNEIWRQAFQGGSLFLGSMKSQLGSHSLQHALIEDDCNKSSETVITLARQIVSF